MLCENLCLLFFVSEAVVSSGEDVGLFGAAGPIAAAAGPAVTRDDRRGMPLNLEAQVWQFCVRYLYLEQYQSYKKRHVIGDVDRKKNGRGIFLWGTV